MVVVARPVVGEHWEAVHVVPQGFGVLLHLRLKHLLKGLARVLLRILGLQLGALPVLHGRKTHGVVAPQTSEHLVPEGAPLGVRQTHARLLCRVEEVMHHRMHHGVHGRVVGEHEPSRRDAQVGVSGHDHTGDGVVMHKLTPRRGRRRLVEERFTIKLDCPRKVPVHAHAGLRRREPRLLVGEAHAELVGQAQEGVQARAPVGVGGGRERRRRINVAPLLVLGAVGVGGGRASAPSALVLPLKRLHVGDVHQVVGVPQEVVEALQHCRPTEGLEDTLTPTHTAVRVHVEVHAKHRRHLWQVVKVEITRLLCAVGTSVELLVERLGRPDVLTGLLGLAGVKSARQTHPEAQVGKAVLARPAQDALTLQHFSRHRRPAVASARPWADHEHQGHQAKRQGARPRLRGEPPCRHPNLLVPTRVVDVLLGQVCQHPGDVLRSAHRRQGAVEVVATGDREHHATLGVLSLACQEHRNALEAEPREGVQRPLQGGAHGIVETIQSRCLDSNASFCVFWWVGTHLRGATTKVSADRAGVRALGTGQGGTLKEQAGSATGLAGTLDDRTSTVDLLGACLLQEVGVPSEDRGEALKVGRHF